MRNPFTVLEKQFERFIERPLRRILGGQLDQADIAKHLSRAMEDERQVFAGKLIGPNLYEVELSQGDADHFKSHQKILLGDLSDYLIDLAARRGITLLGRPEIRLLPKNTMKRGDIRITAKLVDRSTQNAHTRQFTKAHKPIGVPSPQQSNANAWLEIGGNRTVALNQPFLTIGRSVENAIVLDEDDVSRKHAQIKLKGGHYVLTDLNSANGTRVNGRAVTECILRDGDEICLANICMTFKMADLWRGRHP
ncbi:MAG: FhaA domain-containing protein [Ardenticatenaceae bacterium]